VVYDGRASLVKTAVVSNLLANTTYAFQVSVFNYRSQCTVDGDTNSTSPELVVRTRDGSVPSAPKQLTVTRVTGGSVGIMWERPKSTGGELLLSYTVFAALDGDSKFSFVGAVDVQSPRSFQLNGLRAFTMYKLMVTAVNRLGPGFNTTELTVWTTQPTQPEPPRNLRQSLSLSGGEIVLEWDAPLDEGGSVLIGYQIFRNNSLLQELASTSAVATEFRDVANVSASTLYNYTIFSMSAALGAGGSGSTILVRSGNATRAQPPEIRLREVRGGYIDAEWVLSLDGGGLPFLGALVILVRGDSVVVESYEGPNLHRIFTGLLGNSYYELRAQVRSGAGLSDEAIAGFMTAPPEPPTQPPTVRLAEVLGGLITLEIVAPDDTGGSALVGFSFFVDGQLKEGVQSRRTTDNTLYDIAGFRAESSYRLAVGAVNLVGIGPLSEELLVVTSHVTSPGVVQVIQLVTKAFDQLTVAWGAPYDTGGSDPLTYTVELRRAVGNMLLATSSLSATSVTFDSLADSTTYSIRVQAHNEVAGGAWSQALNVTTDPISPGVMAFSAIDMTVGEDADTALIAVTRSNGGSLPAKCRYTTQDGTALAGQHYVLTTGTLLLPSGASAGSIVVPIVNNNVTDDPARFFFVQLTAFDSASGTIGALDTIRVTIHDDGDGGTIQFAKIAYSTMESAGSIAIGITRTRGFSRTVQLGLEAFTVPLPDPAAAMAVQDVDFMFTPSNITLLDLQASATLTVQVINDAVYQSRKVIGLRLSMVSGRASIGVVQSTLLEIVDDGDASPPSVPTALVANALSGGLVALGWQTPVNRGAANVSFVSYIVTAVSQSTGTHEWPTFAENYNLTWLLARTEYRISVAAKNAFGQSLFTPAVTVTTGNPTAPSPPTNVLVTTRTGGGFNLTWSPPVDSGGANVRLYTVSVMRGTGDLVGVFDVATTFQAVFGLLPSTNYNASVHAVNDEGIVGSASDSIRVTTRSATLPSKPPGITTNLVTGGAIYLTMVAPMDVGGLDLTAYAVVVASEKLPSVFSEVYRGHNASFVLNRLSYLTTYFIRYQVFTSMVSCIFRVACHPDTRF
jgi:hypothetical protein